MKSTRSFRITAACGDGRTRAFYARAETGAAAAVLLMDAAAAARINASADDAAELPVTVLNVQRETRP